MLEIIKTKCSSYRFLNEFSFGGGTFNHLTYRPVPAVNKKTLYFETIDQYSHKDLDNYLFNFDDVLKENNYHNRLIDNFDFKLNNVNNYCPT